MGRRYADRTSADRTSAVWGHAGKALPKLAAVFVDSSAKADARNAFWPSDTTSLNALRIALKHHVILSKCNAIALL